MNTADSRPGKIYHYSIQKTLQDYECDLHSRQKPGYLFKHIQQASTEQLDRLGLGYLRLYSEGIVFLLAKIGMRIHRRPLSGEAVRYLTCPQGVKGAQFFREIIQLDAAGNVLMEAQTAWLIIDPATRKILRPDRFAHELPVLPPEQQLEGDYAIRIRAVGEQVGESSHSVRYTELDINGHLNNAVYADIVADHLPFDVVSRREISELYIHYIKEARQGEEIDITVLRETPDTYYVLGGKGEGRVFEAKAVFGPEVDYPTPESV